MSTHNFLMCDSVGCPATTFNDGDAVSRGWRVATRGGRDYCSKHAGVIGPPPLVVNMRILQELGAVRNELETQSKELTRLIREMEGKPS